MKGIIQGQEESSSKLAGEMKGLIQRQEDSSRRQEETNRALDDKLSSLGSMMERALRQFSGKSTGLFVGESSNGNRPQGDSTSRTQGNRVNVEREEDGREQEFNMNSEEYNWAEGYRKEREKTMRHEPRRGTNVQLPKMEFPHFDGSNSRRWKMNCEYYFEMFEVPEIYKTRMAILNFSDEVHEWYRCLNLGRQPMPWELLVEEVNARYQGQNMKNPVDEFKRVHQVGKVEEFIKRNEGIKARLLWEKPNLDEEFFVSGFISGLREEIRHMVELFSPRGLNEVFKCALRVEAALDSQMRKPKEITKRIKFQKYPLTKPRTEGEKSEWKQGLTQKTWQPQKQGAPNYTYEQRKELGLCHKCNAKYYPGHQCTGKVMGLETDCEHEEMVDEEKI